MNEKQTSKDLKQQIQDLKAELHDSKMNIATHIWQASSSSDLHLLSNMTSIPS